MAKSIRLLSCDGGGVRSLLCAPVLAFIETQMRKPLWQCFDYVIGTSAGAFHAAALTLPQPVAAANLAQMMTRYGAQIFSKPWYTSITNPYGVSGATYAPGALESALLATYSFTRMYEAKTNLMVMAYDVDANQGALLTSFGDTREYLVKDVLRATSAAPTYFPPAQIRIAGGATRTFLDGGLVANNPALDGVIAACKRENATVRDCAVLSVGTGFADRKYTFDAFNNYGKVAWVSPLLDITMDGSSDLDDYRMQQLMPDAQYLRCQMRLPQELAPLDNAEAGQLAKLTAYGELMVKVQETKLLKFCELLAR